MSNRLREIFDPTPEQCIKQIEQLNELIKNDIQTHGRGCVNCKYSIYVQQSPYYDYITCKFDKSIELPGGLNIRHCCDRYEFTEFIE